MAFPRGLLVACVALAVITAAVFVAFPRSHELPGRGESVGTDVCLSCHEALAPFALTAHHLSTRRASGGAIAGSFEAGSNMLRTSNPSLFFRMDSTGEGYFQTAVVGDESDTRTISQRFDLVVGSGRKGQTYLSWAEDSVLVQLPVSFWRGIGWVNSPGYPDGLADFGRPVPPRCLECHASYFGRRTADIEANVYDPGTAVLGIGCETCHGPGAEHVRRQRSWARRLLGPGIVDLAELSREGQLEACGLCHGGAARSRADPFSYVPGDSLSAHLRRSTLLGSARVDVHGNQLALLMDSPCFQRSGMTCGTCHDVHTPQREASAFVARCLGCHQVDSCGLFPARGPSIADRCVDCHMPLLPSTTIVATSAGDTLQPLIRTHRIGIHPTAANR